MGLTVGIKTNLNNPKLKPFITDIINNNVDDKQYMVIDLVKDKILADDVYTYLTQINTLTTDEIVIVGIIGYFDQISVINQNKLLKTIEDNDNQIQILIYENENNVLKTIRSRIISYDLKEVVDLKDDFLNILSDKSRFYLEENMDLDKNYRRINKSCLKNNFEEAFILFKTNIKEVNIIDVEIILSIVLNALKQLNYLKTFKQVQSYERQVRNNSNLDSTIDAIFATISISVEIRLKQYDY